MNWQTHLESATGYLELGMVEDANDELERMPPEDRCRPEVYAVRLQIYVVTGRWEAGEVVAQHLVKTCPEQPALWIAWAACRRRQGEIEEAEGILLEARRLHPEDGMIFYNLACYACIAGDVAKATVLLAKAIGYEPDAKALAVNDVDLMPVWDEIGRMG